MIKGWAQEIVNIIYNPKHIFQNRKEFYNYLEWIWIDTSTFTEARWRDENEIWTIWECAWCLSWIIHKDWTITLTEDSIPEVEKEAARTAFQLCSALSNINQIPDIIRINDKKEIIWKWTLEYDEENNVFNLKDSDSNISFRIQDLKQFKEKIESVSINEENYSTLVKRWEKFMLDHITNQSKFVIKKTTTNWEDVVELWFEKTQNNQN